MYQHSRVSQIIRNVNVTVKTTVYWYLFSHEIFLLSVYIQINL